MVDCSFVWLTYSFLLLVYLMMVDLCEQHDRYNMFDYHPEMERALLRILDNRIRGVRNQISLSSQKKSATTHRAVLFQIDTIIDDFPGMF